MMGSLKHTKLHDRLTVALVAENDQRIASLKDWLRQTAPEHVGRFGLSLTHKLDDPEKELMRVFAQVAMARLTAEVYEEGAS